MTLLAHTTAKDGRLVGVILVAVSAGCFGSMPLFARAAYSAGARPTTVLLFRFAIAAVVLLALVMVRGCPTPRGRTLGLLVVLGGVGYVGQSLSYFVALTLTSAALLALLLYVYPVLVAMLATLLFRVPLTRTRLAALALAVGGAGLTIGPVGGGSWLGMMLGLLSAVIYSGYILTATRLVGRADALTSSTVITASAAVVFGVLAAFDGLALPISLAGWLRGVAISLISTVVAILTFLAGGSADRAPRTRRPSRHSSQPSRRCWPWHCSASRWVYCRCSAAGSSSWPRSWWRGRATQAARLLTDRVRDLRNYPHDLTEDEAVVWR